MSDHRVGRKANPHEKTGLSLKCVNSTSYRFALKCKVIRTRMARGLQPFDRPQQINN